MTAKVKIEPRKYGNFSPLAKGPQTLSEMQSKALKAGNGEKFLSQGKEKGEEAGWDGLFAWFGQGGGLWT
jgi:hypothetical protein